MTRSLLSRFFLKLSLVAAALLLLDRGGGALLAYGYHRLQHGEQGRMNRTMDSCRARTVILGSSRAAHHYIPALICGEGQGYNAGKDRQRLPYCLAVLQALYARYRPAAIILDLNPTAFQADENGLGELSVLLPYYHSHPEIRTVLQRRSGFEWMKTASMLYCYNSLPLKILFNNISDRHETGESEGYVPLGTKKEIVPPQRPPLPEPYPLDTALVDCFRQIVQLTSAHHTRLTVVISPIYYRLPGHLETMEMVKTMASEGNFSLIDFSSEKTFTGNGPAHFVDTAHLDDASARTFSLMLRDSLLARY